MTFSIFWCLLVVYIKIDACYLAKNFAKLRIHAHHFNFEAFVLPKRIELINSIKKQFDYKSLEPIIKEISLPGSEQKIDIILHDFVSPLYTLLCDDHLIHI